MKPKISVIIPTYNGSRFITKTLDSVFEQTLNNIEVIVINDGSTDNTLEIIKNYKHDIKIISIKNSGPAAARNVGINASSSDYIALLDHDDIWRADNLEIKYNSLIKNKSYSMIYSYPELIDESGISIKQDYHPNYPSGEVLLHFLKKNWITSFSCTLIDKNIFKITGLLNTDREITTCDDYDMWLKIASCSKILFSDDKSVFYRLHNENLLKNFDISIKAHVKVYKNIINDLKNKSIIDKNLLKKIHDNHLYKLYLQYSGNYYYHNMEYIKAIKMACMSLRYNFFSKKSFKLILKSSIRSVLLYPVKK